MIFKQELVITTKNLLDRLIQWALLLRWNKPSGRLILLIPAGWSLWLTPNGNPSQTLLATIVAGGIFVSGAGCVANDIWDRRIDRKVNRTSQRPLAQKKVRISTALGILFLMLILSFLTLLSLPKETQTICINLAFIALPLIIIYPSTKRWFAYPQAILAICWGFAALIPWAASEGSLSGGLPLITCWTGTVFWTFGFDTVYAMADRNDDLKVGVNSSVLALGEQAKSIVSISYLIASISLGIGSLTAGVNLTFWPIWLIVSLGMQREAYILNKSNLHISAFSKHFNNQVLLGGLLLLGLIISRIG